MKILWITNTIFPYPRNYLGLESNPFGGWLLGLYNHIKKEKSITLAIVTIYDGKKLLKIKEERTTYYLIPKRHKLKQDFIDINKDFNPDLVHIHGTEYNYGNELQKCNLGVPTIVSIQGLVSVISEFYTANIQRDDIRITIRDIIKGSVFKDQKKFKKRGIYEIDTIKRADAIIGRTTWDYAYSYFISNKNNYYSCNESLRKTFYEKKWDINKIEKYSIYVSQSTYPLKGFHIILKAINLLKKDYNDIKVYVAGPNIIDNSTLIKKIKMSGYSKLLLELIKKYKLEDNIIFIGLQSEQQVANYLQKCNVFVQGSSIENSPNSLGEAMMIGTPCIASYVGGTMDLLKDKEEGYLYPFGDYGLLAYYIDKVFSNEKDALRISNNARRKASQIHNCENNCDRIIQIYKKVLKISEK